MIFDTQVSGIPCRCEVTWYQHYLPMRITGWGYGDCDPPQFEEFEFNLLDRKGYKADWLEDKLIEADYDRLLHEAKSRGIHS